MNAYQDPYETPYADQLQDSVDFYRILLTIKHGFGNGVTKMGGYCITKKQAKKAGIEWEMVMSMVSILGLKISNRHGRCGHLIYR